MARISYVESIHINKIHRNDWPYAQIKNLSALFKQLRYLSFAVKSQFGVINLEQIYG